MQLPEQPNRLKLSPLWPLLVAVGVATLAVVNWRLLAAQKNTAIRTQLELLTKAVQDQLHAGITERGHELQQITQRWEYRDELEKSRWQADARLHLQQYPGCQAVEWINPALSVRWIEPLLGNETALNADLGSQADRRHMLERAREKQEPQMTPPLTLLQGGRGFLIAAPVYQGNQNYGFVLGVFQYRDLLNVLLKNIGQGYAISIFAHGQEIYYQGAAARQTEPRWGPTAGLDLFGEHFEIRVAPSPSVANQLDHYLDRTILVSGLILALLLAFTMGLTQRAQAQAHTISAANRTLQLEFKKRQERESQLTAVLQSTASGTLVVDVTGRVLQVNSQFAKLWHIPDALLQTNDEVRLLQHITEQLINPAEFVRQPPQPDPAGPAAFATLHCKDGRVFERFTNLVKQDGQTIGRLWSFRDITERQRLETSLQTSLRQTALLLNSTGEGIYGLDLNGNTTFINPVAAKLLGYPMAELLGRPQHPLIHHHRNDGTPYPQLECPIYATFTDGRTHHVDNEIFWRKDGSSFPVEYTSTPVRDETGRLTGAVLVFHDISNRKQAQQDLLDSEARYRQLIESRYHRLAENARDILYKFSNKRGGVYYSPRATEVLGYSVAHLSAHPWLWHSSIHRDDQAQFTAALTDCAIGKDFDLEYRIQTAQGQWRWLHDRSIGRDVDADEVLIEGLATDITERKTAEAALQTSEKQYRTILETAMDGFWLVDAHGQVLEVNETYCRMSGYSKQELLAMKISDLDATQTTAEIATNLQRMITQGPARFETQHRRKDGRLFDVAIHAQARPTENTVVAFLHDITKRKQAELELLESNRQLTDATAQAKLATLAKSEFLASMSHEVRTPMNGIIGILSLLHDCQLSDRQHELVQIIQSSADALLTIINDILDFSKIEAGKMALAATPFDLQTTVEEVAEFLTPLASAKGLDLIVRFAPDTPRQVIGDAGRIRQVLTNLIGNAVKFTSQGHVLIDIQCERQTTAQAQYKFAVEDTGIGIAVEKLEQIFEKFTQADTSTTRRFGGTGLGLTISKNLIELMGGQIAVTSQPDTGSTFWFVLPFDLPREPLLATPPLPAAPPAEKMTQRIHSQVLVVDDNITNQQVGRLLLENLGCRVAVAANGREAIAMLELAPYDIVFMDCEMPELDGFAATAEIRQRSADGRHIPIIAMTARAIRGDRERCLAAGMDDYISKPVHLEDLRAALARWFSAPLPSGAAVLPSAASAAAIPAPLDSVATARLRELATAANPAVLAEIYAAFLASAVPYIAAIHAGVAAHAASTVQHAAHAFKGASASIGAKPLAELLRQLEALSAADRLADAGPIVAQLEQKFSQVKTAITAQPTKVTTP